MHMIVGTERSPQVSAQQRAENELVKRIRKLRWIGMDDEARALQRKLDPRKAGSVLAMPVDTD
jgi:hypothetical protein